jgi:alpha-L-rhamnosidase
MLNFDMAGFYAKAVRDFSDSARPDGMFTDTAPFVGIQYCGVGWAMAHPLLVSQLHQYYGNRRLMEEQYPAARRWLQLVIDQYPGGIVTEGLSDHEALTPAPAPSMVTPLFCQSARLVAGLARTLGRTNDAAELDAVAQKSRLAYQQRFFDAATGKAGPGTQAGQAFALYSDLLPEAQRGKALDVLLENIRHERQGHLSTGIMGTKFMLDVLSREGHADVAYGIASQTNFPGWGWMLANGATTLWEHWAFSDNTYSHSHPMFGSVSQWFINWLGGIQPHPEAVGFDRIVIRPQPIKDLNWVKSSYDSARGPITSNWSRDRGRVRFEILVPANTVAEIYLPVSKTEGVKEGGKPVSSRPGITFTRLEQGAAVFTVGSGRFVFDIPES